MATELDGILLNIILADGDPEPEPEQFDEMIEEIVPLVCSFFEAKLAERGLSHLKVVWPYQGKAVGK